MISKTTSGFPSVPQELQMFPVTEFSVSPTSVEVSYGSSGSQSSSLLFYLSVLKEKLSQMQTLVGVVLSSEQSLTESSSSPSSSSSMAIHNLNSVIQELIVTATSMMFTCQHMSLGSTITGITTNTNCTDELHKYLPHPQENFGNNNIINVNSNINSDIRGQGSFLSSTTEAEALNWVGESYNNKSNNGNCNPKDHDGPSVAIIETNTSRGDENVVREGYKRGVSVSTKNYEIIELDAADLLARYTHYCQVCGKGFKRDANLRMHMRAHGDEYKTSAALSKPLKNMGVGGSDESLNMSMKPTKYSCPQEGCRWNKRHAKFQPLKSMICVKNHYKRSHCPKMYVCKKCNQKQFSVLSDLRTHEKHCGDPRWQCSCGTTFSRKDKLMGHVALFVGHSPAINGAFSSCSGKSEQHVAAADMIVQDHDHVFDH